MIVCRPLCYEDLKRRIMEDLATTWRCHGVDYVLDAKDVSANMLPCLSLQSCPRIQ
jgi:hypothetical protein